MADIASYPPDTASLYLLDNPKDIFVFRIFPETVDHRASANRNSLQVLNTNQPLTYYQSSQSGIGIGTVKLWTPDSQVDLSAELDKLTSWTRGTDGKQPRLVLAIGANSYKPLCLTRFDYTVSRYTPTGYPSEAVGSLEFVYDPDMPAPVFDATPSVELTERERIEYSRLIAIAKRGLEVTVAADGKVTSADGKPLGTVADLLPKDKIKPEHRGLFAVD